MVNKKKILIGSSDPEFGFGIKSQLEAMGAFSPVIVTGARELIEVEQLFYFSVILLDALLDDFPGFEVCRKLRETGRDTPIILFSRTPEQELAKIRNSWQVDRCLVKSVPVPDLFDRIREVIEAKSKGGAEEALPGRRPEEPKEEVKFDALEAILKEEELEGLGPDKSSEPEVDEMPEIPVDTEPVSARSGIPYDSAFSEALAPADSPRGIPETPPPAPETPAPPAAPGEAKKLDEEISDRLDEIDEETFRKPAPLVPEAPKPSGGEIPAGLDEMAEEGFAKPAPIAPAEKRGIEIPAPNEDLSEAAGKEDSAGVRVPEETGRRKPDIFGEEFIPPEPGETQPPLAARKIELARPDTVSEPIESGPEQVSWNSAMKILMALAGVGFGLGYLLAR